MEQILNSIRDCVRQGRILWSYHVNMRLGQRGISREMIVKSVDSYEIIESYDPGTWYFPSHLVYAEQKTVPLHILFALDDDSHLVTIVTAYRPDPAKWDATFKRRTQP